MSATFKIDGMAELIAALRNLPTDLATEAWHIIESQANAAAFEIRTAYGSHRRSGNLQDHVVVETISAGPVGVGYRVKAASRHAHLYEYGTQARHNAIGANRGSMPARPTFVPVMARRRRRMFTELADLLTRHGLQVSGAAG